MFFPHPKTGDSMSRFPRYLTAGALATSFLGAVLAGGPEPPKNVDPAALERTRESVKMIDDLYKSAVVSITARYVEQQSDTPAATVAKDVFEAVHKKGWHLARLVDATGKPKNKDNLPRTDFEKKAVAEIRGG